MPECVVTIDALAAGGDGVGRDADGRVVFVPMTAPGDRVRVELEQERRRFAKGRIVELLEPGPGRVEPPCEAFGECGGCAWQHLSAETQLEAKRAILRDALVRIGGIEAPPVLPIVASPAAYGYRARNRVRVEGGRVGYRRRRSHAQRPVSRCPVLVPELEERLGKPFDRDGEWELASDGARVRATLVGRHDGPRLVLRVGGERIGFSAGVFAQANALLLDVLAARVAEAAGRGERAVELFAGAGLFTLALARAFGSVVAVEGSRRAAADLRRNLAEADLHHVAVRPEPVEAVLAELAGTAPELLLLDPPRTGLPPGGADALAAIAPARIVYLSCDPATLARDLKVLCASGWALRSVEGFDLFPQTPHVEALVLLTRGAAPGPANSA